MILGFHDQFVPFVEEGSKRHTIRAGSRWKAGMLAHLYANPRQKNMRLLFRTSVSKVDKIALASYESHQRGWCPLDGNHVKDAHRGPNGEAMLVWINGSLLAADEAEQFFRADGFREVGIMPSYAALLYWEKQAIKSRRSGLPFHGQLIYWDYEGRS